MEDKVPRLDVILDKLAQHEGSVSRLALTA